MPSFLMDGPEGVQCTLLLAHGAGAPMDSGWMNDMAALFAAQGIRVARFEFGYMAARRQGQRKPPPRAESITGEYLAAVEALSNQGEVRGKLFIGGKSLGGRVASMVAGRLFAEERIAGLVCLGYPFHPPGQPEKLRTGHLKELSVPTLMCQGTRDPFGTQEEVAGYGLPASITVHWLDDGDHDFKPRKPLTLRTNQEDTASAVAAFASR
ncbi:alpha/beta hydrolase [Pseudaminobacter sp. 19-2017]|uniref:Alpha/beta hydrolase n=1 Tax=Pseudaminobacter soli (ex Zhang et al. 2022) TaxID=2831468 RepID=A0A942I438_9HYPH|nr:alpha/beta family hydrolase [Pseudaminobacter soli]MBS3650854.1 alpha/beta hydrolase [Pseudaminobacter soli]